MKKHLLVLALMTMLASDAGAAGVKIDKVHDHYVVSTEVYTAQVDRAGALSSLVIAGVEFMAPPTEIISPADGKEKCTIPSVYACPQNNWYRPCKLPGAVELRNGVLHAAGNGWTLDYTFQPDAIEFSYRGAPEGCHWVDGAWTRSFGAGYPSSEIVFSFAPGLDRACDPQNQGEFGWPINRNQEPGNFAILAKNGAGLIAEDASWFHHDAATTNPRFITAAPHRLGLLVFNTMAVIAAPIHHRLKLFTKADLAHSLTMAITSPNPNHLFTGTDEVVFPVTVTALYGQTLHGKLVFDGSPYVWQTPKVGGEVPLDLTPEHPAMTVRLPIRPSKPAHYTGFIRVTDGKAALYSQRIGFLFRPEQIAAAAPPADFDAFWAASLARLDKIPLDLTLEERKDLETPAGHVYKAKYRCWGGRWAWAWLNVPKAEGKVPGTMILPPVSVYQPPPPGPADGQLRISVAIHGGDLKDYPAKSDFDYMNTGITSRETYMLRYSYCCLARCFDILKSHDKCSGEVNAQGSSQGGGLSLVLAGIRPVHHVSGVVPALCRIDWTVRGYTRWGPGCPPGQDPKKIAAVVSYFDPANFAHRIHAPLRLGFGLFDFCAPPRRFSARSTPCQKTRSAKFSSIPTAAISPSTTSDSTPAVAVWKFPAGRARRQITNWCTDGRGGGGKRPLRDTLADCGTLAVCRGGHTRYLAENHAQPRGIGEARAAGDGRHAQVGLCQQPFGDFHLHAMNLLKDRATHQGAKSALQRAAPRGHAVHGRANTDAFRRAFPDVTQCGGNCRVVDGQHFR